jgi:hypothetical protein
MELEHTMYMLWRVIVIAIQILILLGITLFAAAMIRLVFRSKEEKMLDLEIQREQIKLNAMAISKGYKVQPGLGYVKLEIKQ